MSWRPSDRSGVVVLALLRAPQPICIPALADRIQEDDELREWWFNVPTPGQRYRRIQLGVQNLHNRMYQLEAAFTVKKEKGECVVRGYDTEVWSLLTPEAREEYLMEIRGRYAIPASLAARARKAAESMGVRVDFGVELRQAQTYYRNYTTIMAVVETRRGRTTIEGSVLTWHDYRPDRQALRGAWAKVLEEAGL